MKLLTKNELQGIDSTSTTIKKWDDFFKTALPNLGFRDSLLKNMYPYEQGIPMLDGTYMPVPKNTGRVFFKMSFADKLAGALIPAGEGNSAAWIRICALIFSMIIYKQEIFQALFPDKTIKDYEDLIEYFGIDKEKVGNEREVPVKVKRGINSVLDKESIIYSYWLTFLQDSDIFYSSLHNRGYRVGQITISDAEKNAIACNPGLDTPEGAHTVFRNMYCILGYTPAPFIYNKKLEDIQIDFPRDFMRQAVKVICGENAFGQLARFDEVYLQDYLVISLNPIDKFMCSTKQAFSSCISIAKQDDVYGTSSTAAFGLPALFPSDSVFMIFMTPGKHKNMYWESSEWKKDPTDRNKDKAYKYLKMTCRSLTYKGTLTKFVKTELDKIKKISSSLDSKDTIEELIKTINPDQPRLFVGRQYSAKGEDFIWQVFIEWLLSKQGIATSCAYADAVSNLQDIVRENLRLSTAINPGLRDKWCHDFLREGALCDNKATVSDRFGHVRGIYFDNVAWSWKPTVTSGRVTDLSIEYPANEVTKGEHLIVVGSSRRGSCSVQNFGIKSGLDMFKMMLGEQNYSYLNSSVQVCSECGDLVMNSVNNTYQGLFYCDKCIEKKQLTRCEACGEIYSTVSKEDTEKHKKYNIWTFLDPDNVDKHKPVYKCRRQLEYFDASNIDIPTHRMKAICIHCGEEVPMSNTALKFVCKTIHVDDMDILIRLCDKCLERAVMCDKCRHIVFLDEETEPVILLPGKRIVCSRCIDSIRAKKEDKELLKEVIRKVKTLEETPVENLTERDKALLKAYLERENLGDTIRINSITKNIFKQISSYLQGNPDQTFPKISNVNITSPSEAVVSEETVDESVESVLQ